MKRKNPILPKKWTYHGKKAPRAYQYKPLSKKEITRFIHLYPSADRKRPLRCDLEHGRPEEFTYEAVSYAWGSPKLTSSLHINGYDRFVGITANLEALLLELRDESEMKTLWIDAISINQNDLDEKSRQVLTMADFYRQAELVIAWVGEDYDSGAKVVELFGAYTKSFTTLAMDYANRPSNEQTSERRNQTRDLKMESLEKAISDTFGNHNLDAISNFFSRPWFERRWVIQEIMSAENSLIRCGSRTVEFNHFVDAACETLVRYSGPRESPLDPGLLVNQQIINQLRAMKKAKGSPWSKGIMRPYKAYHRRPLLSLLKTFQAAQCLDDRDRIYALAGLSDDIRQEHYVKPHQVPHPLRPKPMGRKSLPLVVNYADDVEKVYTDLAILMLEKLPYRPEEVLKCAGAFRNVTSAGSGLPSWVPDWRAESRFEHLSTRLEFPDDFYSDWGSVSVDKKILRMKGWQHSIVSQTVDGLVNTSSFEELKRVMKQWWDFYSFFHRDVLPSEHDFKATRGEEFLSDKQVSFFHMTIFGGFTEKDKEKSSQMFLRLIFDGNSESRTFPLGDGPEAMSTAEATIADQSGLQAITPAWKLKSVRDEIAKVMRVIRGRSMCRSKNGELMMCPGDAQAGDMVVILKEVKTPFIIRLVQKGHQTTFRLIGDCYVQGMQVEMGTEEEQEQKYGKPSVFQMV